MHPPRRCALSSGLAGFLVAGTLSGAVAGGALPDDPAWLPELTRSDALDGPIVVEGRLLDERERPIAGHVTLVAWPRQELLAPLGVGDGVKLVPVGKAVAADDGSFVLRIDPDVPMGELMEGDGTVNFDVVGESDGRWAITSFHRRLVDARAGAARASSTGDGAGPSSGRDLTLRLRHGAARPAGMSEPAPVTDRQCMTIVHAVWDGVLDTVGEVYTGPNATGDLKYLSGSTSTVGVGFSASGDYGSFEASGTSTVSSTSEVNFPTQGQRRLTVFRTTFGWKKFELRCFAYPYGPWTSAGFEARAVEFQGGTYQYTAGSPPSATYCTSYLKGSSFSKDTASAIQFTNGAKIGSFIGIDLSTRTGFNTSTKITFTFVNAGRLCGSNGYPPQAARVVAK
jgi:hypothetical protein